MYYGENVMSFKKIMLVFSIGLSLCTALRVFQIVKTIEYQNGFFIEEQKTLGIALIVAIAIVCLVVAIVGNIPSITPEKLPRNNKFMSIYAVFTAVSLFAEAFYQVFPITVAPWQMGVIRLATFIAAAYFIVVALNGLFGVKISPMVHIIPIIYTVIKTTFTFIGVSSLALISDNILIMAGYCLLMLFFINYGKLYSGIISGRNSRKVLSTGLVASLICISQSVAFLIANIAAEEKYLHLDINAVFTLLYLGVFALGFVVSYFGERENSKKCT